MITETCRLCKVEYQEPNRSEKIEDCDQCKDIVPHYSYNEYCNSGGKRQHDGCVGRSHCTCDRCF